MRILAMVFLPLIASGATLSTDGSIVLRYFYCTESTNPATCQNYDLSQSAMGGAALSMFVGRPPIIGGESLEESAGYGGVFLDAYSNTGITGAPPNQGQISSLIREGSIEGRAGFEDVIHFVGGPAGFLDATLICDCFRLGAATAFTTFQVGNVLAQNLNGGWLTAPPGFNSHLVTPFSAGGTVTVSVEGHVTAQDEVPSDPLNGASEAIIRAASVGSFKLTDAQGNVITPFYYSDSGTRYFGEATYVPEPGTWLLVAAGFVVARLKRTCV
jgi:hypothetical protein